MNVHFSYFMTIMYFWEANQRRLSLVTEKKKTLQRCRKLSGFRFDLTPEILVQIIAKHYWIPFFSLPAICCFRALMHRKLRAWIACYIIFRIGSWLHWNIGAAGGGEGGGHTHTACWWAVRKWEKNDRLTYVKYSCITRFENTLWQSEL